MIFIDPVIEKASEERTVHKNIRIEENEIHYSEKNQELYIQIILTLSLICGNIIRDIRCQENQTWIM